MYVNTASNSGGSWKLSLGLNSVRLLTFGSRSFPSGASLMDVSVSVGAPPTVISLTLEGALPRLRVRPLVNRLDTTVRARF